MKTQTLWILAGITVLGAMAASGCGRAQAQDEGTPGVGRSIQLTIYKQDFAVVREERPVTLKSGRNKVHLQDVSRTLDPMTVMFDWKEGGKSPEVVSNTYDLGVHNGGSLLKRLEGKTVEMLWNSQDGEPRDKITGTLEATGDGGFVIRSGEKLYVNPNGTIVATGESSLVTMPRLSAEIDSPDSREANLALAYQTRSMSWSADYVGKITAEGDAMELECWATLENHTGIDYPNATITLVAGAPNRAAVPAAARGMGGASFGIDLEAAGKSVPLNGWQTQAVGELYAYKVPAAATVGQEQMNRVKMLDTRRVPIKKDYNIRLNPMGGYDYGYYRSTSQRQNATLAIALVNDEKSGLGIPLPSGAIRLYDDAAGAMTFIGADTLGDTPKDQRVNLSLSKVFDVYSDAKILSSKRIDKRTVRKTFEAVIHNEKKAAIEVRLVQDFYGKKKVQSETVTGKQLNSSSREWRVRVDAGGKRTLTWTIDFAG